MKHTKCIKYITDCIIEIKEKNGKNNNSNEKTIFLYISCIYVIQRKIVSSLILFFSLLISKFLEHKVLNNIFQYAEL